MKVSLSRRETHTPLFALLDARRQRPAWSTYRFSRNDRSAEHTNWFSLVFSGDLAILAMELEKGTNLYVEGTFDQRPYVGPDKCRRYIYEVSVHKFFVTGGVALDAPAPPLPHPAVANEVVNDGAPSLETPQNQDTWLL